MTLLQQSSIAFDFEVEINYKNVINYISSVLNSKVWLWSLTCKFLGVKIGGRSTYMWSPSSNNPKVSVWNQKSWVLFFFFRFMCNDFCGGKVRWTLLAHVIPYVEKLGMIQFYFIYFYILHPSRLFSHVWPCT